jgi:hypothetical protein
MIPAELTALPQWVGHDLIPKPDGKLNKPPYSPHGGMASSTDPATWGTYDQVLALVDSRKAKVPGFAFTEACGLAGVDFDDCRDPETGTIEPWVMAQVRAIDTYTEISPSGRGVKVIGRGQVPHNGKNGVKGRHPGQVEMYSRDRFFTITGNVLPGYETIRDCQQQLEDLHLLEWPRDEPHRVDTAPVVSLSLADDDILQKIGGAKNGAAFMSLYSGDTAAYGGDHSAADLALVSMVAFYTQDADQLGRIVASSGLNRPKWARPDYRQRTIDRALSTLTETYTPGRAQTPPPVPARVDTSENIAETETVAALQTQIGELQERLRIAEAAAMDAAIVRDHNDRLAEQVRRASDALECVRLELSSTLKDPRDKLIGLATVFEMHDRKKIGKYTDPELGVRITRDGVRNKSGLSKDGVTDSWALYTEAGHTWGRQDVSRTVQDATPRGCHPETDIWVKPQETLVDDLRELVWIELPRRKGGTRTEKPKVWCSVCNDFHVTRKQYNECQGCGNTWDDTSYDINQRNEEQAEKARLSEEESRERLIASPVNTLNKERLLASRQTDTVSEPAKLAVDVTTGGQDDAPCTPTVETAPVKPVPVVHFVPEPSNGIEAIDIWQGTQPPPSTVMCRHVFGQECHIPGCKHQSRYVPMGAG